MRAEFEAALEAARKLEIEELPRFIGELEEVRCTAMARLTAPRPSSPQSDELLGITEAADRLGMSKDYLYRHHTTFPFTRRIGRGLRFSALGIEKYIKTSLPS
jgi:predicted DNA-binding transcriptional regulator AlpA